MVQKLTRISAWVLPFVLVVLTTGLLYASSNDKGKMSGEKTVTGCLQKGQEPNGGFFIMGENNTHWELYPSGQVSLADHVGHTITVTGTVMKRTAEQEQTSQPYEKKEMGKMMHHDLQVTNVKMVSESCNK